MAELLTKRVCVKQLDTDVPRMQSAVDRFGTAIRDPKVKFGLFYYAGHGLQQDWRNYLVPVSARIRNAGDVTQQTVDVSGLLRYMEQAVGRSFLVVLDACRDDPFAGSFRPAKGLTQFNAPVGSLALAYSSTGSVAQDGEGANGLYTGFLLREFTVPGTRLEDAFKRVRLSVRMASRAPEVPWKLPRWKKTSSSPP
ncbi:MAG: caspase family protein [Rhodoferax sp.]|nr:caspase family protein [Rhodoferax sp.]